jgi:hypothetical protein
MSRSSFNQTLVAILMLATSNALGATPGTGAAMPAERHARAGAGAVTADDAADGARTMTLPACAASASSLCLDSRAGWATATGSSPLAGRRRQTRGEILLRVRLSLQRQRCERIGAVRAAPDQSTSRRPGITS